MATISTLQVGRSAPPFNRTAVMDGRLRDISLTGYTEANHWVLLLFFPKAWSFIFPTEIKAFSARLEEFLYARSCAVAFVSTDSEYCLRAWNATGELEGGLGGVHVPLISDCNHQMSKDYGVLIEEEGVAQRAMFIIDPKGVVRSMAVYDADVGRSVDEAQRVLDALIFKDEFGEGCPADWQKGDKGIDMTAHNASEGSVAVPSSEPKKTWSEWARPKLNRAFSGTSQRSFASYTSMPTGNSRQRSDSNLLGPGPPTPPGSGMSSGNRSPLVSPHSFIGAQSGGMGAALEEAIMQQRMDNLKAVTSNLGRNESPLSIGLAN